MVYDPELKETPEWESLYSRYNMWPTNVYKQLFDNFLDFYNWSMANGFAIGAKLVRWDVEKPYTPDNCRWVLSENKKIKVTIAERDEFVARWNKSVNRIRVHYGLQPFA